MSNLISTGTIWEDDDSPTRSLYVLRLDNLSDWPRTLELRSRYFGLFLASDARHCPEDEILRIAELAYSQGCRFLDAWGPDCERVHDLFDHVAFEHDTDQTVESVLLTSWWTHETLDDALYTFVFTSLPASDYSSCESWLACVVGNDDWAAQVIERFRDPQKFADEVLANFETHDEAAGHDDFEESYIVDFTPTE
jgi:hypothetical protein